jgi:hypothetical protein
MKEEISMTKTGKLRGSHLPLSLAFAIMLPAVSAPALADSLTSGQPPAVAPKAVSAAITQVQRYTIPNYTSQDTATTRSFIGVTIINNATVACNAAVSFQYEYGATNICVISQLIPAKQSRIYCSRPVTDPITPCAASCSPALGFNTGHAYVSSDNTTACSDIAVDAQQYFTEGSPDDHVDSQSKLTVTKFNLPNNGD